MSLGTKLKTVELFGNDEIKIRESFNSHADHLHSIPSGDGTECCSFKLCYQVIALSIC